MEYHKIKSLEEIINTRGSKLWIKMNDNSRALHQRTAFTQEHGGFFIKNGREWKWIPPEDEKNGYWLKRADTGEKTFFTNMAEFAKEQGMTSGKICDLLNGTRKTYKGWTAVEIRAIKPTEGAHFKVKKVLSKKIAITKQVVFQDIITKQLIVVDNVREFAKNNNLSSKALYRVSNGRAKSHKNLILYNPFSNKGDFNSDK